MELKTPNGLVTIPDGTTMSQEEASALTSAVVRSLTESGGWPDILAVALDLESYTGLAFSPEGSGEIIRFRFEAELPVTVGSKATILPYKDH